MAFPYPKDQFNEQSGLIILSELRKHICIHSVLDVGCGNGSWLKAAKDLQIEKVFGVDNNGLQDVNFLVESSCYKKVDLNSAFNLHCKFDLVMCLEVAEHLDASSADKLIESLVSHGDIVLFSAAIPGQRGFGHINEQWPDYWQARFNKFGFVPFDFLRWDIWNNDEIKSYYRQNIILYAKREVGVPNKKATETVMPVIHPGTFKWISDELVFKEKLVDERGKLIFAPSLVFAIRQLLKAVVHLKYRK